jgi:hypothetical protein
MSATVQIAVMLGYLLPLAAFGWLSRRAVPTLRPIRVPTRRR